MYKTLWIGLVVVLIECIDSVRCSSRPTYDYPIFDVTGTDFLNTQTEKLCLLARLNVSIQLSYRCENGNWWLDVMYVNVSDSSKLLPAAPATCLVSNMSGNGITNPKVAGGLVTGVSVQRGYICKSNVLEACLNVTSAVALRNKEPIANKWAVKVYFYAVEVQPFLVTNHIVKDPLLCKDVTLFLIFIIIAPVLYFLMFIAYYRVKERFGSPKFRSKWPVVNFSKQDGNKKLLVSSTTNPSSCNNTSTITVTCTTADGKEMEVLTSETNCSPPQEK